MPDRASDSDLLIRPKRLLVRFPSVVSVDLESSHCVQITPYIEERKGLNSFPTL